MCPQCTAMHIHPSSPNSDFGSNSLQSEESAAIKIQAGFRGYRVRKQLTRHQHQSRSTVNGYQQRHHHQQHHSHRRQQRRQAAMTTPSQNTTAAGFNGGTSATAQLRDARSSSAGSESNSIEDRCATKIQAGVRGFLVRKKQKIATDAATKIQAGFRGFKARKETQKLKQK